MPSGVPPNLKGFVRTFHHGHVFIYSGKMVGGGGSGKLFIKNKDEEGWGKWSRRSIREK